MNKKITSVLLAAAAMLSLSMGVFAADASTTFTYELRNEPTYTVSVPETVDMTNEGSEFAIAVSDVQNLAEDERISVTIAGTQAFRDQLLMDNITDGKGMIRYQIITPDGRLLETTGSNINGTEIVSFTEEGSKTCTVKPVLSASSSTTLGRYTGTLTYGIEVVKK